MTPLRRLRFAFAAPVCLAVATFAQGAAAAPTEGERSAARALFNEGRRLIAAHDYAAACPKLAESQRIDPGIGTQFNLADCQEHTGKIASAWENYLEVANQAKVAGQQAREQVARQRAAAIAPRLSRMVIVVEAGAADQGVVLRRDGADVRRPLWGTPVVVDPGEHEIIATAPGFKQQREVVDVKDAGAVITVTIHPLQRGSEGAPVDGAQPAASGWGKQRVAAIVVAGAGVAAIGAGTVLGLVAKGKANDSNAQCNPADTTQCTPAGVAQRSDARGLGDAATAVFIAGGACVAAGAVLWFTAPSSKAAPASARVVFGPASIGIEGSF